jgi:hypothetical protein
MRSGPVFFIGVIVGALLGVVIPSLFSSSEPPPSYERAQRVEACPPCVQETAAKVLPRAPATLPETTFGPETVTGSVRPPRPKTPHVPKKPPGPTPEELIKKHFEDSIDVAWNEKAAQDVQGDLDKLRDEGRFAVTSIDCRRTSCIAVLEWEELGHVQPALIALLGASYTLDCRKLLVAPGRLPSGGIQSQLIFYECKRGE